MRKNYGWSDYGGLRKAKGAISIVKFRNQLKKWGYSVVSGGNVRINGELRGCSGFLQKNGDERLVYFDTDVMCGEVLYRTAQHLKDYSGGINCYADFNEHLFAGLERLYKFGDWSARI